VEAILKVKILFQTMFLLNKISHKDIIYKDKYEEFFFNNYYGSYNTESNQAINFILPYKSLNYYISDKKIINKTK